MQYKHLTEFLTSNAMALQQGPIAMIFVEDEIEIASTLRHHKEIGFATVLAFIPDVFDLPPDLKDVVHRIDFDASLESDVQAAVNQVAAAAPGVWMFFCFNAEYLFFPFCESRSVNEMLSFHEEERREAMLTYVIDLYADDLSTCPNAVSLRHAHLDRSGYYALARNHCANVAQPKERQLDFFGGLRWRFEEHVPTSRRKIDRISLFRAKPGVTLREDHSFSEEEYNTYACPWHHNITAAVCSFRAAKALKRNPGSRHDIKTFRWHNSEKFEWNSQQLLDLGLIEPGQWF